MCGIFFSLGRDAYRSPSEHVLKLLRNRGPDSVKEVRVEIEVLDPALDGSISEPLYATFVSSVLALRGEYIVTQPLVDEATRSVLCWNGEAWKIDDNPVTGNDSEHVFSLLLQDCEAGFDQDMVVQSMMHIKGPYAFVFYDGRRRRLYFGRDCLGRRSLLKSTGPTGDLILSSVCDKGVVGQWSEIEADGIHWLDLSSGVIPVSATESKERHIQNIAFHVAYAQEAGCGEVGSQLSLPYPPLNKSVAPHMATSLDPTSPSVRILEEHLRSSLALRVRDVPKRKHAGLNGSGDHISNVAVLFSGGLDCTVLARLMHDLLPETETIDLLNVAFENPRIHKTSRAHDGPQVYDLCPDRITAKASHSELQTVCPGRNWRLVEINVPFKETQAHRDTVIRLMHPHNTEMDLSIAYALYFACRGIGVTDDAATTCIHDYATPARVLLSGLGADELFGGYQRHATAFARRGYQGLVDELELDINRLGKRNLGRDDRVLSHWGRETRFPYLDEDLLKWALAAPVWEKCGFDQDLSDAMEDEAAALEPGKKALRLLAWKLGMRGVAKEKKRAIQFGARTAKMEGGKMKGTQLIE
ncbi:hypothetical protein H2201_000294 [Coniosporium apollinis]|uniref:Glutamine amidotransferase type-2 domain-containing protein n=1 Tax=Coniosporium apollinis TaxID=61459 RepID=A0ABQ9PAN5_9PEZI|nr:hypothetical protein H2201_000294 [Coniosporium apollinis]